jgi:hypothetical protein
MTRGDRVERLSKIPEHKGTIGERGTVDRVFFGAAEGAEQTEIGYSVIWDARPGEAQYVSIGRIALEAAA